MDQILTQFFGLVSKNLIKWSCNDWPVTSTFSIKDYDEYIEKIIFKPLLYSDTGTCTFPRRVSRGRTSLIITSVPSYCMVFIGNSLSNIGIKSVKKLCFSSWINSFLNVSRFQRIGALPDRSIWQVEVEDEVKEISRLMLVKLAFREVKHYQHRYNNLPHFILWVFHCFGLFQ